MFEAFNRERRDRYLDIESWICQEANNKVKYLVGAPANEIMDAIRNVLSHAERTDKRLSVASREHQYYRIMAERYSCGVPVVLRLRELLRDFEGGNGSHAVEAVAATAVLEGVCSTIDFYIQDLY